MDKYHLCCDCQKFCECGGDTLKIPACMGCGRKECPGNVDDEYVQSRED